MVASKLIDTKENVVPDLLRGLLVMNPNLRLLPPCSIVLPPAAGSAPRVAIISGGGSGHEPAHAGFVGEGMLTGAVAGAVFASPSVEAIVATIKQVDMGRGVLLIVKNYGGDVMNFGLASAICRSAGHDVQTVIVGDDIAPIPSDLPPPPPSSSSEEEEKEKAKEEKSALKSATSTRRGIAGTVLVHKLAGAVAREGGSLEEVTRVASEVAKRAWSVDPPPPLVEGND